MSARIPAPSPEVQYLPTIFRRIQTGDIRIPAFQRGFIWKENQVLELLESIYKGYPIGSLLFWRVSSEILHIGFSEELPFPNVEPIYPLCYVLDGMQRLSSLYGVFHESNNRRDEFKVVYDFKADIFINVSSENASELSLPLESLFVPKKLLEFHSKILQNRDNDIIITKSLELQATFQEYLLPTVTISRENVGEVVEIFQRINSTGTNLGTVDFMRALTWSGNFDLNQELAEINKSTGDSGFIIDPETMVKIIAVVMGYDPIPAQMLMLKSECTEALKKGVSSTVKALHLSIVFLATEFYIYKYDMLPYEGLLLGLVKVFNTNENPSQSIIEAIKKWFWSISFNEALRGKPDHYVARALRLLERVSVEDNAEILDSNININNRIFIERRFIKGKALSIAYAAMFAKNRARSLLTGKVIPPEEFMSTEASESFLPLFSLEQIKEYKIYDRYTSSRVFANLFLTSHEDKELMKELSFSEIINRLISSYGINQAREILLSQFFSDDFIIPDLNIGDIMSIFVTRSHMMNNFASSLA